MHISFVVESITLNDSVISQIKSNNMIKLSVIHKLQFVQQEYLVNNPQGLSCINHTFKITKTPKNLKELVFTVRKVEKKWCLENLFMASPKADKSKKKITFEALAGMPDETNDTNIQYKYEQLANSLLGYCKINIENLERGANNKITADIITKNDSKVIGQANISIYILNEERNQMISRRHSDVCSSKIIFEDPDCYLFDK